MSETEANNRELLRREQLRAESLILYSIALQKAARGEVSVSGLVGFEQYEDEHGVIDPVSVLNEQEIDDPDPAMRWLRFYSPVLTRQEIEEALRTCR